MVFFIGNIVTVVVAAVVVMALAFAWKEEEEEGEGEEAVAPGVVVVVVAWSDPSGDNAKLPLRRGGEDVIVVSLVARKALLDEAIKWEGVINLDPLAVLPVGFHALAPTIRTSVYIASWVVEWVGNGSELGEAVRYKDKTWPSNHNAMQHSAIYQHKVTYRRIISTFIRGDIGITR